MSYEYGSTSTIELNFAATLKGTCTYFKLYLASAGIIRYPGSGTTPHFQFPSFGIGRVLYTVLSLPFFPHPTIL